MPSMTPDTIGSMYPRDVLGAEMLFETMFPPAD